MAFTPPTGTRGYFGIWVWHVKFEVNIGTLLRSAHAFGANFVFTVGRRYEGQSSDVSRCAKHVPTYHYTDTKDLLDHLPTGCMLIGVELTPQARTLKNFEHPQRACYLLGAEDHGLNPVALDACHRVVYVSGASLCLNVASAGTIVMYDRIVKGECKW